MFERTNERTFHNEIHDMPWINACCQLTAVTPENSARLTTGDCNFYGWLAWYLPFLVDFARALNNSYKFIPRKPSNCKIRFEDAYN